MKEIINRNKYIIFSIASGFICFLILISIYLVDVRPRVRSTYYDVNINSEEFERKEKTISDGTDISQTFKHRGNISGIKIGFKSYDTEVNGNLFVSLYDEDNNITVGEWKFNFDKDNSSSRYEGKYLKLDLKDDSSCILTSGIYNPGNDYRSYKIEISSDCSTAAPSIYYSKDKLNEDNSFYIDGSEDDGELYLKISSKGAYFISKIYIALSVILITFISMICYLIFYKKFKISKIFVIASITIGFIYMIIMTPYSISDEYGHISTAYRYSNVLLGKGYQTSDGNMLKRKCDIKEYSLDTKPSASTYYAVISHFSDHVTEGDKELVEVPGDHIGNVWQYIPTSIGITIARVLNLGYIPLMYIGRIFNFIFFVSMIYLGIRKIPFGKITMFTVSMMPMTIHQGMSFSYDSIVYGLSFLFISYVIYIAFTKNKIKLTDVGVLLLSGGILSTCKAGIFIFICLACLIIPKDRFKNKKTYYAIVFSVIACAVIMLFVFNFVKVSKAVTMTTNNNLQNFQSVRGYVYSDIIRSPLMFFKVVYNTIKSNADFYVLSTIGGYLSWSAVNPVKISSVIIIIYIIILILSSLKTDKEDTFFNLKDKIIFCSICILIFGAFLVVAFTWTPYGQSVIFGLQGRYFVTFLPLIAFVFRNNNIVLKHNIDRNIMFSICCLQVITIACLYTGIIGG